MMGSTLHSRRERAAISPEEANRQAFGQFCADLERLKPSSVAGGCMTWLMFRVAKVLGEWTLREGFDSLAFPSLRVLSREAEGFAPYLGLGANDFSLAVNGCPDNRRGLAYLGILEVDVRSELESGLPHTIWSLRTDVRLWSGVPADGWWCGREARGMQLDHVRALRRWPTPALQGLQAEPDLKDALASVANAESVPDGPLMAAGGSPGADARQRDVASDHAPGGRLAGQAGGDRPLTAAVPSSRRVQDARQRDAVPNDAPVAHAGAGARRVCSENRNAERLGNAGGVPIIGTPLKTEEAKDKRLKIILKSWRDYEIGDKKEALYELETCQSGDRMRRLLEIILGDDIAAHDTGKWINANRAKPKGVQGALRALIEDMAHGVVHCAGRKSDHYGTQYGLWIRRPKKTGDPLFKN